MHLSMTNLSALQFLHIVGVILLVGNITVTAIWKVFADRTADVVIVAYGQRMVTGTDFGLTVPAIVATMIGGYGSMHEAGYGFPGPPWLIWGQLCFVAAGCMWLGVLIPMQIRQARMAKAFTQIDGISHEYRQLSRRWLTWGIVATVPLIIALYLMIAKPG